MQTLWVAGRTQWALGAECAAETGSLHPEPQRRWTAVVEWRKKKTSDAEEVETVRQAAQRSKG